MNQASFENSNERQINRGSISDLRDIVRCLNETSPENRTTLKSVFYDTIKLTSYRQERLDKKQLSKQDISKLLFLAHYINSNDTCADVKGDLLACHGSLTEDQAKKFFADKVRGTVKDTLGQNVEISEKSLRCIYKDYKDGGKHNQTPTAYEEMRGKSLPWIRHTLQNSKKVLQRVETQATTFFYCMDFKLFYDHKTEVVTFLVIARKEKRSVLQPIELVTAFRIKNYNGFLKRVEKFTPSKL